MKTDKENCKNSHLPRKYLKENGCEVDRIFSPESWSQYGGGFLFGGRTDEYIHYPARWYSDEEMHRWDVGGKQYDPEVTEEEMLARPEAEPFMLPAQPEKSEQYHCGGPKV